MRADQRALLLRWRIPFRQIGPDLAFPGIKDSNIIPFLRTLNRPTLFTHDQGFFQRKLIHSRYCLVWLDASDIETASYVRRLLRHPRFDSQAKRMGLVIRAHRNGIHFWQRDPHTLQSVAWPGLH